MTDAGQTAALNDASIEAEQITRWLEQHADIAYKWGFPTVAWRTVLADRRRLAAELEEVTDLDRSALKHQELKDERARAVRMWHDEKKRVDQAEVRIAELEAELKLARSHRIASPSKAVDPTVHTPERIAAYLIARGWRPRPGSRNLWDLRNEETVHVHHAATASDYLGRTGLLVSDLASVYGQGEMQVLADIAEAGDE